MQEVFSKTTDLKIPLQEQECFELRIDDHIYGLGGNRPSSLYSPGRSRRLVSD